MPLKKLFTSAKKSENKAKNKNANCTKFSAENLTNVNNEDEDEEGNEFLKATRGIGGGN